MTTVWIYVDTDKKVGDRDHLKVFATTFAANQWFEDNEPLGVAFEYDVIEPVTRINSFKVRAAKVRAAGMNRRP